MAAFDIFFVPEKLVWGGKYARNEESQLLPVYMYGRWSFKWLSGNYTIFPVDL